MRRLSPRATPMPIPPGLEQCFLGEFPLRNVEHTDNDTVEIGRIFRKANGQQHKFAGAIAGDDAALAFEMRLVVENCRDEIEKGGVVPAM